MKVTAGIKATVAATILLTAQVAYAWDWADGDKDWYAASLVAHALKANCPVPSGANVRDGGELYHDLLGILENDWGQSVELGYKTHNWFGVKTEAYYEYTVSEGHNSSTLWWWNIGSPGTNHNFSVMKDNNLNKWAFYFDGGQAQQSIYTSSSNISYSWAGVYANNCVNTKSDRTRWANHDYANFGQWYWHGGWPATTTTYEDPQWWFIHASGRPAEEGYTEVYTDGF